MKPFQDNAPLLKELEQLSIAGIHSLHSRNFGAEKEELHTYLSPSFQVILGYMSSYPINWEQARLNVKTFFEVSPNARYQIRNTSSDVDLKHGTAVVYLELTVEGAMTMEGAMRGVAVHGIGTCMWKQDKEGKWLWQKYWSMRNMSGCV